MPQIPARFCGRCHRTALPGSPPRCAMHQAAPKSPGASSRDARYQTARWRRWTRQAVLSRDALCAFITMGVRCQRLASEIHHIVSAEVWTAAGQDFFDVENLVGLCAEHHGVVRHMAYSVDALALPWRSGK
jgi:hypothetical protein